MHQWNVEKCFVEEKKDLKIHKKIQKYKYKKIHKKSLKISEISYIIFHGEKYVLVLYVKYTLYTALKFSAQGRRATITVIKMDLHVEYSIFMYTTAETTCPRLQIIPS